MFSDLKPFSLTEVLFLIGSSRPILITEVCPSWTNTCGFERISTLLSEFIMVMKELTSRWKVKALRPLPARPAVKDVIPSVNNDA